MHLPGLHLFSTGPEKSDVQPVLCGLKQMLVQTICLAQLTLDAVAADRPLVMTFGDGNKDTYALFLANGKDGTNRICGKRKMLATEKIFQCFVTAKTLFLAKRAGQTLTHLPW